MNRTTKLQPLIIIGAAITGLLVGIYTGLGEFSAKLIEPALMVLLFFVFLAIDLKGLKDSFRNLKFTLTALITNFIWTPLFAFVLGWLLLGHSIDLRIGFLMLMVTPCTDWYLVFTGLAKGNVALNAMILPLNLLLQVLLLPVYLFVFMGGEMKLMGMSSVFSIIFVLMIPFAAAQLLKFLLKKSGTIKKLREKSDDLQLVFLCIAIIAMFASESRSMVENPIILLQMLVPTTIFFAVNFLLAQAAGRVLSFKYEDTAALTMTTLARNSPLSLAIAVAAFPDRPLISLALVIGPLLELPILSVVSNILLRIRNKAH